MKIILNEDEALKLMKLLEENEDLKLQINILENQVKRYLPYKEKYEKLLVFGVKGLSNG